MATAAPAWRTRRSSKAPSRRRWSRRWALTLTRSSKRPRRLAVPTSSESRIALPAMVDLHARPAANFVRTAMAFNSQITVAAGDREADAKSLLAVLALGAKRGSTLRLTADGDDADRAVGALCGCVANLSE